MTDKQDIHAELMRLIEEYGDWCEMYDRCVRGRESCDAAQNALEAFARSVTDRLAQAEQESTALNLTMDRQTKRIAELEAQLEAVGAGGVEPTRAMEDAAIVVTPTDPTLRAMNRIAQDYAHRLALALECVLFDYPASGKWYDSTMQVVGDYRSAMNTISEQESPTFMGEPLIKDKS